MSIINFKSLSKITKNQRCSANAELMRQKRELDNSEISMKVLEDKLVRVKHELEEPLSSVPEIGGNLLANKALQRDFG